MHTVLLRPAIQGGGCNLQGRDLSCAGQGRVTLRQGRVWRQQGTAGGLLRQVQGAWPRCAGQTDGHQGDGLVGVKLAQPCTLLLIRVKPVHLKPPVWAHKFFCETPTAPDVHNHQGPIRRPASLLSSPCVTGTSRVASYLEAHLIPTGADKLVLVTVEYFKHQAAVNPMVIFFDVRVVSDQ